MRTLAMHVFRFDTVDSTNEMAKRLISEGRIRESAWVVAREQTAGKGTHGRAWVSPRDAGIYLSVIETLVGRDEGTEGRRDEGSGWTGDGGANGVRLATFDVRPATTFAASATLTRALGEACAQTLSSETEIAISRRSVNDLFVGPRKLGGILAESVYCGGRMTALIVGVGINVRRADRAMSQGTATPISLEDVMPVSAFEPMRVESLVDALVMTIRRCIRRAGGAGVGECLDMRANW